jgi:hypothetical protein
MNNMGNKPIIIPDGIGFGDETLSKYDEGTWTPTVTSTGGTITTKTATGKYTRVGNIVSLFIWVEITNVGTGTGALIVSTPFTSASHSCGTVREYQSTGAAGAVSVFPADTSVSIGKYDGNTLLPPSGGFTYRYIAQVTIQI